MCVHDIATPRHQKSTWLRIQKALDVRQLSGSTWLQSLSVNCSSGYTSSGSRSESHGLDATVRAETEVRSVNQGHTKQAGSECSVQKQYHTAAVCKRTAPKWGVAMTPCSAPAVCTRHTVLCLGLRMCCSLGVSETTLLHSCLEILCPLPRTKQ